MQLQGRLVAAGLVVLSALLTSCGGGGDSGGGGSGLTVTADRSSLRFTGFVGSYIPQETIHFTIRGGSGTYYGGMRADRSGILQANFIPTSDTTATVNLSPTVSAGTAASGSITFLLCRDAACAQVVWSQTMPYAMNIFEVSANSLTLSGHEGAPSAPTQLTITPPDTTRLLAVSVPPLASPAWLSATRSSDSVITVNTSGAGLLRGNYQSSLTVSFASLAVSIAQQTVPVSFTVGDGIALPPARALELTRSATGASLAGTAPIGFQGSQTPAWTASSDRPWLVLSNASGTGPGTLSYAIDTTRLDSIENWGSATATVRVSATGLSDASFQISLAKRLPEVLTATPNPMVAGRVNTLRVAGKGFSQLDNANLIRVGNAAGVTGVIVSDTDAVLTVPALAAGNTMVSIDNAAGMATTAARASVVTPTAFAATVVPSAGEKRSALFDPVRNALYTINTEQSALQRYQRVSGQWQSSSLAVASIGDMGFSPDRTTLYVSSGPFTLLAVDPDTLQVRNTHVMTVNDPSREPLTVGWGATRGMAVTNNLRLWFGEPRYRENAYYFDMRRAVFAQQALPEGTQSSLRSPQFYASGDGSKMMLVQYGLSPAPENVLYTSGTDSARTLPALPQIYGFAVLNEDGSKLLADWQSLYSTADGALLGTLQMAGYPMNSALSANGSVAYVLVGTIDGNGNMRADHIEVFDTTRFRAGSTTSFESLGQIALPGQALDCGVTPAYGCSRVGSFLISPLGNTLFWVGNQGVAVIPIPTGMAQANVARTTVRAAAR